MIGIFKQKAPGNVALLLIVGLILKLPLFIYAKPLVVNAADGKLYQLFASWINNSGALMLVGTVALLLLYIQALIVSGIINEYRMTARHTFLPGLAYLTITSLLPEWSFLSAPLMAATLILWAFAKLFHLYNAGVATGKIYNIGLLLGLASFIHYPSFLFAACIITGLLILRPFRLNEILLLLVGIITPSYFYGVYLFLTDQFSIHHLFKPLRISLPQLKNSLWLVGTMLFLIIPFLIGAYYIQGNLGKMLIQARKNWSIILLCLFFGLFLGFINGNGSYNNWIIIAAPFATFHACAYFYLPKTWVASLIFTGAFIFILVQQYSTMAWR